MNLSKRSGDKELFSWIIVEDNKFIIYKILFSGIKVEENICLSPLFLINSLYYFKNSNISLN